MKSRRSRPKRVSVSRPGRIVEALFADEVAEEEILLLTVVY